MSQRHPGPAVARIEGAGFQHHELSMSRSGTNPLAELRTIWALFRLFRRVRPMILHAVTIKPVLYSGFVARLAGVPALVQAVSGLGHVFIATGWASLLRRFLVRQRLLGCISTSTLACDLSKSG